MEWRSLRLVQQAKPGVGAPGETTPWTRIAARGLPSRRCLPEKPGSTRFGALRRTAGLRGRIRGLIEELVEQELEAALGRGRYERAGGAGGHRHGHRRRQLNGSFGPVELAVPRARLRAEDGSTREWRSAVLPRYA